MRILFTFAGGRGHLEPLLPVAHAAEAAGHTVAVTGRASIASVAAEQGLAVFHSGPELVPERRPLVPLDAGREDRVLRDGFAGRQARTRAAAVLELCGEWRPDVLVCDETDPGSMVAAERLGLPYASVLVTAAGSFVRRELLAEPLNALRAEHGLSPDPELALLSRYLVLSPFPPSFRDPAYPLPATAHSIDVVRAGRRRGDGAPLVYVSLGTVFNLESGDLFTRILAGVRELPVDVLVTVGNGIEPAELGPQPPNVSIEQFVPQAEVLARVAAVVSHGGSGSVLGTLAHGVPLVALPMGADQPHNAARIQALGVGRVLDPISAAPEQIREAASAVLDEPGYREAATRLRDELAALPGPEHAVTLLESLVDGSGLPQGHSG